MGNFSSELSAYQPIPRDLIFDCVMTDRARFLYCYMAAKPLGWDFYLVPMSEELGYSVDTLRKYLGELIARGWLVRGVQLQSDGGRFGAVSYTLKARRVESLDDVEIEENRDMTATENSCLKNEKDKDEEDNQDSPYRKNSDTVKNRHGKIPTRLYNININSSKQTNNNDNDCKQTNIASKELDNQQSDKKEEKRKEKILKEKTKEVFPPEISEIRAYVEEKGYHFDVLAFHDYYASDDWHYTTNGKRVKVRNWKRCCAVWESKWREQSSFRQHNHQSYLPYGMILGGDRDKILEEAQKTLWD